MEKIIPFIIFLISSCGSAALNVLPRGNNLPDGIAGQDYFTEIEITNAILFKENVGADFTPSDSGLKWQSRVLRTKR